MEHTYYDLTEPQKSIWLTHQLYEEMNHSVTVDVLFKAKADLSAARRAVNLLYRYNQILRAGLTEADGTPKQYFNEFDNGREYSTAREFCDPHKYKAWAEGYAAKKLNAVLCEISIVDAGEEFGFLIKASHMVIDGASALILLTRLKQYYNSIIKGDEIAATEYRYRDFIKRERLYYENSYSLSRDREYWQKKLAEIDAPTIISAGKINSISAKRLSFPFSPGMDKQIKSFCMTYGVGESAVLLACFALCASAHFRTENTTILCYVLNRIGLAENKIPGMFVNTLPLVLDCRSDTISTLSALNFIKAAQKEFYTTIKHFQYSYNHILGDYFRLHSHQAPSDISFSYQNFETDAVTDYSQEEFFPSWYFNGTQITSLTFHARREPEENLKFIFEYQTDKFKEEEISYFGSHLFEILNALLANPEIMLSELEMTSAPEREKILIDFNSTYAEYPKDKTIIDFFEQQARKTPDNIALRFENQTMTYAELNAKANRLAYRLRDLGIVPDSKVAIMADRSMEMIIGLLATLKSGGAYVPIDPSFPEARIKYILEDCAPKAVLIYKTEAAPTPEWIGLPSLDLKDEGSYSKEEGNPPHVNSPDDLIFIIYTSGTTGRPKGVMIEHHGIMNLIKGIDESHAPNGTEVVLQFSSLSFDLSLNELILALLYGGSLCLISNATIRDPQAFDQYIKAQNVSMAILPPNYIMLIDPKNFRRIMSGGSATNNEVVTRVCLAGAVNTNEYGPTETTCYATYWDSYPGSPVPAVIPIGRPIKNVRIYILYGLKLCGIGVPGELCIAGDGLARGYLNLPELTVEKFIKNPFEEGGLYRSGDLARWLPDGNIEYLGRMDGQVKIRGFRIELGEIESVLRKQPGVTDAAAVSREIGGDSLLCAYYVAKPGRSPDISALREGLSKELPEYMIPAFLIQLTELPLTRNGKLDKTALPEPGAPAGKKYEAPGNDTERIVTEVFEHILGITPIGINDNFFELGGHSLRAATSVNMIEKSTGIRLPLRVFFASPTPKLLAKELAASGYAGFAPIPKADKKANYAMSSAQKRLFVLEQITGGSFAYNIPAAMVAFGELDLHKIQKATDDLIKRHETLRTSFTLIDGEAVQVIADEASAEVEYEEIEIFRDCDMAAFVRPFDLGKAPLLRVKLIKERRGDRYILLFDIHHIIADGMTINILIEEFSKLYGGEALKPLELQYKDYTEWMRGRDLSAQKAYWKQVFSEEAPVLDLTTDYQRPKIQSFKGSYATALLDRKQKDGIDRINSENGTTAFMTLLAAFMTELHKYSRQDDIVVGIPISGRVHKDTGNMTGMFVNTLALRGYPSEEKTFAELLAEIKTQALNAYENQEYPFEELVEDAATRRDVSRSPLFDVMFAMQNNERVEPHLGNARLKALDMAPRAVKFDLTLQVTELLEAGGTLSPEVDGRDTEGGYVLRLEYCSDLFTEASAKAFLSHFVNLVDSIIEKPNAKLSELGMTSERERERLLMEFNDTIAEYPKDKTVIDLFEEQVGKTPGHIALKFIGQTMTYAELNAKANKLAYRLRALGIKPESRVALIADRGVEMIVGLLGTLKAGGAYVPIDPGYPPDRIRYMLEDCAPKAILTYKASLDGIDMPTLDLSDANSYADEEENPPHVNKPGDLIYIIYTSGTTGKPKGVMLEHGGVVNLKKRLERDKPGVTDTVLQFSNLSFDASVYEIASALFFGGALSIVPNEVIQDVGLFEQYIDNHDVTMTILPPIYAAQIDYKKFRRLVTGGSVANRETVVRANRSGIEFTNEYGPTETTVVVSHWDSVAGTTIPGTIPIGRPIKNTQIYILNGLELCGIGVPGELCIAGAGLARGYLNQPELTNEKFIKNPYGEGRLYRSGDLARWAPDGNLDYLGRIDEQIKLRGFRIELGEIESVLRRQPGVADAVVALRAIGTDESLCAYLVAERGQAPDIFAVKEGLRKELPEFMIPAFLTLINALPINRNGKLDKAALPEPETAAGRMYAAPENAAEQAIISAFEQILGISPIGAEDSFFELGGHSIKAIAVANVIEKTMGIRLPLHMLFASPTPKKLAMEIKTLEQGKYAPIPKAEKKSSYIMSSAQKRLFIIEQIKGAGTSYNIPAVMETTGGLELGKIQQAFDGLLKRHEILRTSFAIVDGEAVQMIADNVSGTVEYEEKDTFGEEDIAAFIRPFDLGKAPLIRVKLVKERRENRSILLFDMHHIISDGVTVNILFNDFSLLYSGQTLQPPEVSYKDYSEWARGRALGEQRSYWMQVFSGVAPILDLTADFPRPKTQSFRGSHVTASLDKDQRAGVGRLNAEYGTTAFMTLLAAFMVELHKYSRQNDIAVGIPISGRIHKDTETMAGMFVNTLALRGRPSADKTFIEFLTEIKSCALDAYENQEYPFEELVEDVAARRDMSRNPLFDAMFVLQDNERAELRLGDAVLRPLEFDMNAVKFDLTLQIEEAGDGYKLRLEYCSDLFTEASALSMLEHFICLVDSILARPELKISELDMLSEPERIQLLMEFNATDAEYPKDKTVVDLFEEQVRKTPDNIALKFESQTMTYAELNAKANRLAHRLREMGIGPDSRVALMAERGMEMIVGLLGTIKAGGAYIPIDPNYPRGRIEYMLGDSAPTVILQCKTAPAQGEAGASAPAQGEAGAFAPPKPDNASITTHADGAGAFTRERMNFTIPILDLNDGSAYAGEEDNPARVNAPDDLIYIIYTSGTTGKPKGVMIEHRGVVNLSKRLEQNNSGKTDTISQFASLSFDAATVEIMLALLFGGALCIVPHSIIQDIDAFERYTKSHGVTIVVLPPGYAAQINLSQYRKVITGGSAANRETIIRAGKSGVEYTNEYGPTETTVMASYWDYRAGITIPAAIPIGRPIFNTRIYILNGMELCGIGIPGELCIAGAGLARGYLNQPELTVEKFIKNPYGEGRLYRSGDLARWLPDGNIEYLGRIDEQVKLRGYRIELGEIESVLRAQPGVADAAAAIRETGGGEILCAYLIAAPEWELDLQVIREGLEKELPEYMIPAFMTQIEALPLNRNGKLDKDALPEPFAPPRQRYAAPDNALEQAVIDVFEDILNTSPVGMGDSFFELGGDSLKSIRAVSKLREKGYNFTASDLMRFKTARSFCDNYRSAVKAEVWDIPIVQRQEQDLNEYDNNLKTDIYNHICDYDNNIAMNAHSSECDALFIQRIFLEDSAKLILNCIKVNSGIESATSALRKIIASQGALRTGYDKTTRRFVEYEYRTDWEIPVMCAEKYHGDINACVEAFDNGVRKINLLDENKLSSRLLLLKLNDENCLLLGAFHHSIWDRAASELFTGMLNDRLLNVRLINDRDELCEYSYVRYCAALNDQNNGAAPAKAEAEVYEQYILLARKAAAPEVKKDPARRIDLRIKLNIAQKAKFADYPIETAMTLLTALMYHDYDDSSAGLNADFDADFNDYPIVGSDRHPGGDTIARLPLVPFAVLKHNRNEQNFNMLGLTLAIHIVLFDAEKKKLIEVGRNTHANSDGFIISEKMLKQIQNNFNAHSSSPIPIINYLGIYQSSGADTHETISEEPFIEISHTEMRYADVFMEYNIQNNILNAMILGLEIDKKALKEALEKL